MRKNRRKCAMCSIACVFATGFLIVFAMLTIFGLINPDPEAWIGKDPYGNYRLYPTEEDAVQDDATKISNAHGKVVNWNKAGHYMVLSQLVLSICLLPVYLSRSNVGKWLIMFLAFIYCFAFLFWWTYGMVFRFSRAGQYASAEGWPKDIDKNDEQYLHYHSD